MPPEGRGAPGRPCSRPWLHPPPPPPSADTQSCQTRQTGCASTPATARSPRRPPSTASRSTSETTSTRPPSWRLTTVRPAACCVLCGGGAGGVAGGRPAGTQGGGGAQRQGLVPSGTRGLVVPGVPGRHSLRIRSKRRSFCLAFWLPRAHPGTRMAAHSWVAGEPGTMAVWPRFVPALSWPNSFLASPPINCGTGTTS